MSFFWINILLIVAVLLLVGVFVFFKLTEKKDLPDKKVTDERKFTLDALTEYVKRTLHEMTNSNLYDLGLSAEEFRRRKNKRAELKKALKGCTSGDINDKNYVKFFIFDLLLKTYGLNDTNINLVIPFEDRQRLTAQDKFEILLYHFKKKHGYDALSALIQKYDLDRRKQVIEDGNTPSYIITTQEIDLIFKKEIRRLLFEDKLNIIVQRIYQTYKGFSVIDEIRDMNIDGISGGVSGLPASFIQQTGEFEMYTKQMQKPIPKSHDSIWLFYKGKSIHLQCITFGSELELKRVCQNIYKYNNPGQLSESNGFKVNEMKDGSRVVVVRPNFSESWAFFVRKFDVPNASLEQLIRQPGAELPITLIQYLVKGCRITAVTGAQGSGKTTLLMAMVRYINAAFNVRVQEMAFELHLRKIYPERNILSFRETDTISGQAGLDVQKKTDGTVNILGEVATDPVAAWMIQMSQVASLFTLFTHHAKTFRDLVFSLRNSLLKTGMFNNETIAEQQVISVINFDIHLKRDFDGKRYIERITECVPLDYQHLPYPEDYKTADSLEAKLDRFMSTATEYFKRTTDRQWFESRNIIEFRNGQYVAVHPISDSNLAEMCEHMSEEDAELFRDFLREHWRETELES
ncbi:Flp pilus assembly complex ATPase component TadA [Tumebacillus flagellatus]|uniref:Pilus assembly protein CpaF n=1 Tax=Tumebacillus flagellatus TaxID=1157490 RepID=A0A074M9Z0_9BACL|nr:Flp pilus assembly complex ATPase component TadA [Tumebacillus flagellatus]KEO82782.1 pilus assembly protein CpaF [Tumebacillus flagellatus]